MAIVLSHATALRLLRVWDRVPHAPYAPLCPGLTAAVGRAAQGAVVSERPSRTDIDALLGVPGPIDTDRQNDGGTRTLFDAPLDVLVDARDQRSQSGKVRSHVWTTPLAQDALWHVQDGLEASSPEFCFLQHATVLDPVRLALLGCELEGTYSPCPSSPYGIVAGGPLTTPERLSGFLDRCAGLRGAKEARQRATLVLPNAASPMEARIGLFLSLPRRLGGWALPRPTLNMRFDVDGVARRVTDRGHFRGDLCWPEARIAVEYDSDAAHTGSDRIAADTKRRNALTFMGVTVIGVTRQQAFDYSELSRVAFILRRLLGAHPRGTRPDQEERCRALHATLFGTNATNRHAGSGTR